MAKMLVFRAKLDLEQQALSEVEKNQTLVDSFQTGFSSGANLQDKAEQLKAELAQNCILSDRAINDRIEAIRKIGRSWPANRFS